MIRYSIRDKSNDSWLKFITPAFPVGLWAGQQSAKTFETLDEAEAYLTKLSQAVADEAVRDMKRLLDGPLHDKYKVTRFFAIANDAGCDIDCYEVVPTKRIPAPPRTR